MESKSQEAGIEVVRDESSEEYDCAVLKTVSSEGDIVSNLEMISSSVPPQMPPSSLTDCDEEREDSVVADDSHGMILTSKHQVHVFGYAYYNGCCACNRLS